MPKHENAYELCGELIQHFEQNFKKEFANIEVVDANIGFIDTSLIPMNSEIGNVRRNFLKLQVTLDKNITSEEQKTKINSKQSKIFFFI